MALVIGVSLKGVPFNDPDMSKATGVELSFGGYGDKQQTKVQLDFAETLLLLQELTKAVKAHHDALSEHLATTGKLAALGAIINND